jgi:hypothetical protein
MIARQPRISRATPPTWQRPPARAKKSSYDTATTARLWKVSAESRHRGDLTPGEGMRARGKVVITV